MSKKNLHPKFFTRFQIDDSGVERLLLEKITVVMFFHSKIIRISEACHLMKICFI
jgi:hypothetical protein